MGSAGQFFVPGADDPEATWEELRQACRAPQSQRRIYSITFVHDRDQVQATVGQPLAVRRHIPQRSRRWRRHGENLEPPRPGATVYAIFEGDPYKVFLKPGERTEWVNPFMVGPSSIQSQVDFETEPAS